MLSSALFLTTAAITILIFSQYKLPVSTSMCITGATVGVGLMVSVLNVRDARALGIFPLSDAARPSKQSGEPLFRSLLAIWTVEKCRGFIFCVSKTKTARMTSADVHFLRNLRRMGPRRPSTGRGCRYWLVLRNIDEMIYTTSGKHGCPSLERPATDRASCLHGGQHRQRRRRARGRALTQTTL